jgi:hypothetical protein
VKTAVNWRRGRAAIRLLIRDLGYERKSWILFLETAALRSLCVVLRIINLTADMAHRLIVGTFFFIA